jgi:hypothetical protein
MNTRMSPPRTCRPYWRATSAATSWGRRRSVGDGAIGVNHAPAYAPRHYTEDRREELKVRVGSNAHDRLTDNDLDRRSLRLVGDAPRTRPSANSAGFVAACRTTLDHAWSCDAVRPCSAANARAVAPRCRHFANNLDRRLCSRAFARSPWPAKRADTVPLKALRRGLTHGLKVAEYLADRDAAG